MLSVLSVLCHVDAACSGLHCGSVNQAMGVPLCAVCVRVCACVRSQLPLDLRVREQADIGAPIAISQPDHPCAQAYFKLAERVMTALKDRQGMGASQGPTITFE